MHTGSPPCVGAQYCWGTIIYRLSTSRSLYLVDYTR